VSNCSLVPLSQVFGMARLVDQTPVTSPHSRIRLTGSDIQVAPTPTEHARTQRKLSVQPSHCNNASGQGFSLRFIHFEVVVDKRVDDIAHDTCHLREISRADGAEAAKLPYVGKRAELIALDGHELLK